MNVSHIIEVSRLPSAYFRSIIGWLDGHKIDYSFEEEGTKCTATIPGLNGKIILESENITGEVKCQGSKCKIRDNNGYVVMGYMKRYHENSKLSISVYEQEGDTDEKTAKFYLLLPEEK